MLAISRKFYINVYLGHKLTLFFFFIKFWVTIWGHALKKITVKETVLHIDSQVSLIDHLPHYKQSLRYWGWFEGTSCCCSLSHYEIKFVSTALKWLSWCTFCILYFKIHSEKTKRINNTENHTPYIFSTTPSPCFSAAVLLLLWCSEVKCCTFGSSNVHMSPGIPYSLYLNKGMDLL